MKIPFGSSCFENAQVTTSPLLYLAEGSAHIKGLDSYVDLSRIGRVPFITPDPRYSRPLSPEERAEVIAQSESSRHLSVEVLRTDPMIHSLGTLALLGDEEAAKMRTRYASSVGLRYLQTIETAANQLTTIIDPRNGLLTALHVDNRNEVPLECRLIESQLRHGAVMGGARLLHLVQPDIVTMASSLGIATEEQFSQFEAEKGLELPTAGRYNLIPWEYLRQGLPAVSYTLRVEPGYSWRASTDTLLHGASSLGIGASAIQLFLCDPDNGAESI